MTEIIDLDAIRPERKPKKVKVNGKTYSAKSPSMGVLIDTATAAQNAEADPAASLEAMRTFMEDVFGVDAAAEIYYELDLSDFQTLMALLLQEFGEEGKGTAPSRVSRRNGARSKPTSNGSTKSTSAKRASGNNSSTQRVSLT